MTLKEKFMGKKLVGVITSNFLMNGFNNKTIVNFIVEEWNSSNNEEVNKCVFEGKKNEGIKAL